MSLQTHMRQFCWLIVLSILLVNGYGFKLIIDMGYYGIHSIMIVVHFVASMTMCATWFLAHPNGNQFKQGAMLPLVGLPILSCLVMSGGVSLAIISVYVGLLYALIICLYWVSHAIQYVQLEIKIMGLVIGGVILWGNVVILESVPWLYDMIAPYTLMYHFFLIQEGFFHISTGLYVALLMVVSWALYRHD